MEAGPEAFLRFAVTFFCQAENRDNVHPVCFEASSTEATSGPKAESESALTVDQHPALGAAP